MEQSHMTRCSNNQHRDRRIKRMEETSSSKRMEEDKVTAEMRRETQRDLLSVPKHPF